MVTVLWTGSDKFGQVWTSQKRCEVLFFLNRESHALQIWPTHKTSVQFSNHTSLETLRPSQVVETAPRHTSIGIRCELVWSATFLRRTTATNTSLESSQLAEFECAISARYDERQKKLWLSIISAWRPSERPGLGQTMKGVDYNFSWQLLDESSIFGKLSISEV